jgi:hypothetical protein
MNKNKKPSKGVVMKSPIGQFVSLCLIIILSLSIISSALAEKSSTQIYKWVDSDGNVHYAARPGNRSAQKMHLGSNIFHNLNNNDKKDKQKKGKERDKLCTDSKITLAKYKKAPFLNRYDEEAKKKVRLSKKETKAAFLQVEKDVSYWCNPPINESTTNSESGGA